MPRVVKPQPDFRIPTVGSLSPHSSPALLVSPHLSGRPSVPHSDYCPCQGYMSRSALLSPIMQGGQAGWCLREEPKAAGLPAAKADLLGASRSPTEGAGLILEGVEPKPGRRDNHSRTQCMEERTESCRPCFPWHGAAWLPAGGVAAYLRSITLSQIVSLLWQQPCESFRQ